AAQCPESTLRGTNEGGFKCPADSIIGSADGGVAAGGGGTPVHIYNVVPEPGYPAEFGFEAAGTTVFLRASVLPSSSGYVLSTAVPYVPRASTVKITGVTLTFFGDPAEQAGGPATPAACFTNRADCQVGPLSARLEMNSWVEPERWVSKTASMYEASPSQGVSGCDLLQFSPTIAVMPETTQVDTPSGYEVDLKVPQAPNLAPVLATPQLKDAEVTLPEGTSVSPGAADGLVGCKERGPEGIELGDDDVVGDHNMVQEGEEEGPDGLVHAARGHCPLASQIGDVEVVTPVLASPLHGH